MKKIMFTVLTLLSFSTFATECFVIDVASKPQEGINSEYEVCASATQNENSVFLSDIQWIHQVSPIRYAGGIYVPGGVSGNGAGVIDLDRVVYQDTVVRLLAKKKLAIKLCSSLGEGYALESFKTTETSKNICRIGSALGIQCRTNSKSIKYMDSVKCSR